MLKGIHPRIVFEYGRGTLLSIEIDRDSRALAQKLVDDVKDCYLSIDIKPWRDKRSIDANAYAWVLIGKIADTLTKMGSPISKDEMYEQELRKYGQGGVIKLPATGSPERILKSFRCWEQHEKLYGENSCYYRVWVGSSHYNTEEMSIFIDGIVEDAKELGIETLPPAELERMLSAWERA